MDRSGPIRGRLHAKGLTRSRGKRPAWSPELHNAWMIVAYWNITVSSILTKQTATQQLKQLVIRIACDQSPHAP